MPICRSICSGMSTWKPVGRRFPDGMAGDIAAEAARYEALIAAAGGIDLLLLGIGANGHIAFNEPGSDFASRTREIRLDEASRIAEAGNFPDPASVPERAITIGHSNNPGGAQHPADRNRAGERRPPSPPPSKVRSGRPVPPPRSACTSNVRYPLR